jgi:hypothetical protein
LIRTWTEPLGPLRSALRDAGLDARLFVVDFEAALNAALERGGFHAVIYDPYTTAISLHVVEARMREHMRSTLPLVLFTSIEETVEQVRDALARTRN